MRILLTKLKLIGDALLLTPTVHALRERYPEAEIVVVVRKGTEGILAGCTAIDRLLTAAAPEGKRRGRLNWLVWPMQSPPFWRHSLVAAACFSIDKDAVDDKRRL